MHSPVHVWFSVYSERVSEVRLLSSRALLFRLIIIGGRLSPDVTCISDCCIVLLLSCLPLQDLHVPFLFLNMRTVTSESQCASACCPPSNLHVFTLPRFYLA